MGSQDFVVQIPTSWASFFITMLLSPNHFDWAKTFLASHFWKIMVEDLPLEDNLSFALPSSCPDAGVVTCESSDLPVPQEQDSDTSSAETSLSESAFRRSPRIKSRNGGFKHNSCPSKNCFACTSKPPNLSLSSIKSIGEKVCKLPADKLSEKVLKSKPKILKAIGDKKSSSNSEKGKKTKKTPKNKPDVEDDDEA